MRGLSEGPKRSALTIAPTRRPLSGSNDDAGTEHRFPPTRPKILVTGASGYVGGRLVPALLANGCEVRCLVRTPAKLDDASWRGKVEVVTGSVGDDLTEVLRGVDVAV